MQDGEIGEGLPTRKRVRPPRSERLKDVPGMQGIIASSGISLRFWRLYAYFWLICLTFPVIYLVRTELTPLRLIVAIAGLLIFVTIYFLAMWPHPLAEHGEAKSGWRSSPLLSIGLTAFVLGLSLAYGTAFTWLFLAVSAVAGITLPVRRSFWAVLVLTLLTLGVNLGLSDSLAEVHWLQVIPLVLLVRGLGLDMAGLARLAEVLRELHTSRRELAHQAVVNERLRLARDIHDLLGHTLSMITLKSELAGHVIENDPTRAAQEIHEVEHQARQALREVRQAVAGYREQTLAGELEGARQILEAAGIACTVESTAESLPQGLESALAWTVREGVTNVIRHSHAKRCFIRIAHQDGTILAEVVNDGYDQEEGTTTGEGSGLTGLAERVAAQGGQIETSLLSTRTGPGFRLRVKFPPQNNLSEKDTGRT